MLILRGIRGLLILTMIVAGLSLIQDRGPNDLLPYDLQQAAMSLIVLGVARILLAIVSDAAIATRHRNIVRRQIKWVDGYDTMPTAPGQTWQVAVPRVRAQF